MKSHVLGTRAATETGRLLSFESSITLVTTSRREWSELLPHRQSARQPERLNRRGQIVDAVQGDGEPGRVGAVAQIAQQQAEREHLAEEEPVVLQMQ